MRLTRMGKQEDFVLRALEERDVRFVRLWFTDVLGFLKSVAVAPAELENAFDEGIGFDGSAIEGFARVYEADMLAKPDPATFQILPWRSGDGPATARMFCDIVMPDGSPSYADPRFVLKRTLSRAAAGGYTFYTHPEIEFYLFKHPPEPGVMPVPVDRSGFFDHTATSRGSDFRREAITMLEQMGISVAGSEYQLSASGRAFIAGLLRHAAEITCVTNQWVNSYKRLIGGGEAPSYICWGHNNRSAMVRIPMYKPNKGQSTRVELRTIDPACNPYLAFAVILAAGMKGIEEGYELPPEAEDDVWSLTDRERSALGIQPLPGTLAEAITLMEESELLADTLGERVFDFFLRNKRSEWAGYRGQVSAFERDQMLPVV